MFDIKYEKPSEYLTKHVTYGTAGFRMKATELDWIMYRMGILATIRSIYKNSLYIGCMITASHNPEHDNGCKLIDPFGDMLESSWELYATKLVNSNDLHATVKDFVENEFKIDLTKRANVAVAHDTRPSCGVLLDAFRCGVEALNGNLVNYGLLSTPQLHYIVRCSNTNGQYGEPNEQGYFKKISKAFLNVAKTVNQTLSNYENNLYVDGANGVGAIKLNILKSYLQDFKLLNIHIFNDSSLSDAKLNHLCGADHVKLYQKCPNNTPENTTGKPFKCCSLDGDADRIVYFYDDNGKFSLLDGDKISTFVATYIKELIENTKLNLNVGIVQTAYANGSSTHFIENSMKVTPACVPTGVRHLHHKATEYDIGVYFEANGHGTVIFNERTNDLIDDIYYTFYDKNDEIIINSHENDFEKRVKSIFLLKNLRDCINQTVGDALSDLLIVELILLLRNFNLQQWNSLYEDLPNRQLKVCVKDRNFIKTYDAERRVSEPKELQDAIDEYINSLPLDYKARAFVRPSGTEDVVRVYAESHTQYDADYLANKIAQFVYDLAGGVGKRPE